MNFTGTTAANRITGTTFNDSLVGGTGNDTLDRRRRRRQPERRRRPSTASTAAPATTPWMAAPATTPTSSTAYDDRIIETGKDTGDTVETGVGRPAYRSRRFDPGSPLRRHRERHLHRQRRSQRQRATDRRQQYPHRQCRRQPARGRRRQRYAHRRRRQGSRSTAARVPTPWPAAPTTTPIYVDFTGDKILETGGAKATISCAASSATSSATNLEDAGAARRGDLNGTGNALANTIVGTDGKNILDGKGGDDILSGQGGDDTYFVDSKNDLVGRGQGRRPRPHQEHGGLSSPQRQCRRPHADSAASTINGTGNDARQRPDRQRRRQ